MTCHDCHGPGPFCLACGRCARCCYAAAVPMLVCGAVAGFVTENAGGRHAALPLYRQPAGTDLGIDVKGSAPLAGPSAADVPPVEPSALRVEVRHHCGAHLVLETGQALPDPCPVCRGRHPAYRIVRAEGPGGHLVSMEVAHRGQDYAPDAVAEAAASEPPDPLAFLDRVKPAGDYKPGEPF